MSVLTAIFSRFYLDEDAVVTVDLTVVTAVVASLGVATLAGISGGLSNQSTDVATSLTSMKSVVTSGDADGDWFLSIHGIDTSTEGTGDNSDLTPQEHFEQAQAALEILLTDMAVKKAELADKKAEVSAAKAVLAAARVDLKNAPAEEKEAARAIVAEASAAHKALIAERKIAAADFKTAKNAKNQAAKTVKLAKKNAK